MATEIIVKVSSHSFRKNPENGATEQWNPIQKRWGGLWKNVDEDAVSAAFVAASKGNTDVVAENPADVPPPVLSDEEAEALAEAAELQKKLEAAKELVKAAKEKAAKAKAARIAREKGITSSGVIGERMWRDPVKLALLEVLRVPEGEDQVLVTYGELIAALPPESLVRTVDGVTEELTRYELAKLIQSQLGQLSSVAIAGSKAISLVYQSENEVIFSLRMSAKQEEELAFFTKLLSREKAASPRRSRNENIGTVTDTSGDDDEDDEDLDDAA